MGHDGVTKLAPDLITWRGKLTDVIELRNLASWKEAFGRFEWTEMTADHRFVLTWSDPWSQALPDRIIIAHYATILLNLVNPFRGVVHRMSGAATSIEPVKLDGISTHERLPEIPWPLYAAQPDYFSAYRGPNGTQLDPPSFPAWCQWITDLDKIRKSIKPLILRNAVSSFERGLTHRNVDARIPEMVRAAEAIIALPRRNGGVQVFVRRAMKFIGALATDPYLVAGGKPILPPGHIAPDGQGQTFLTWFNDAATTDLERWLAVLYGHRSDCVHGKVPFEELQELGGGDPEAARFDWLAEQLAREAVSYGFRRTDKWSEFRDRSNLEDAWRPADKSTPRMP
jgi:hypothetical protein